MQTDIELRKENFFTVLKNRFFIIVIASLFLILTFTTSLFVINSKKLTQPDELTKQFTIRLFKVAPPYLEKESIDFVFASISKRSQKKIKSLKDIADFIKAKTLPDKGFEIVEVIKTEKNATVKMKWNYTNQVVFKKFFLVFENGQWKIDSITNLEI